MTEDLITEEVEETNTIYQRRVEAYKDKREKVLSGGLNCIPSPFPRFRKEFPGIERGKYYLLSGSEKAAKSQISDYLFVLHPLLYAYHNPDKVRVKILYFSLEMSEADKLDQWVCFFLYYFSKGRIRIDTKYLNSLDEDNPLSEEIIEILESDEYKSIFNFIEEHVIIDENTSNPYGIYKACIQLANERGVAHKKTVKWRNETTGELEDREVLDYFEPNDPNEYWICLTDHLSLMTPEKGMNLRETIGKFSSKDCVRLRNIYGFSIVNIQQQAADREGNESIKLNRLTPSTDGLGENKTTARDASLMFGIFSPWRHERLSWLGYDIATFQDNIRFLEIVRNRNGRTGAVCPLYFDGAVNFFTELPHSDDERKMVAYKQMAQKAQSY